MSEFNMTQLDQDIDTLRDVFMTNSQREALARVQALASNHARLQAKLGKLQAMQARMRDPERQMVCDIIANGMDRETAGVGRYEVPDAQPATAIDLERLVSLRNRLHAMACRVGPEWEAEAGELQRDVQHLIEGQAVPRGPDQPDLCDLCRVREEVRSDAEGIPFCQECWDGWQAEEAKAVQP